MASTTDSPTTKLHHTRKDSQNSTRSHISFASAVSHRPGENREPERQLSGGSGFVESPMAEGFPETTGGLMLPQPERSATGVSQTAGSDEDEHSYANVHWGHSPSVPRSNEHRCLILCFDGTGDQFDNDNSNVVNFFSMLKKDDPSKQLVYYQAGIGTYSVPQLVTPFMAKLQRTIDAMVGRNLHAHVMGGYEFLMQNYHDGDRIFMFGFSRGAYTARALAGMIHKVGLLPRSNYQQVPFAYQMYSSEDELSWQQSTEFKKSFSIDVDIELIGVWDTVSSVGVIPRRLPFTASNAHVKYFRHAVALDEHRVRFVPNFWSHTHPDKSKYTLRFFDTMGRKAPPKQRLPEEQHREKEKTTLKERFMPTKGEAAEEKKKRQKPKKRKTLPQLEKLYGVGGRHRTHVQEVWFAGCHADVGGGAVQNHTRNALARIPLRWMVRQCFELKTGILFLQDSLMKYGLDPDTLYPEILPRPDPIDISQLAAAQTQPPKLNNPYMFISEEIEDLKDALSPSYDELMLSRIWWLLEILPAKVRVKAEDGTIKKKAMLHWGRPRQIPPQHDQHGVKVHETVKQRMQYLTAQTETPVDSENPLATESVSTSTDVEKEKATESEKPSRKGSMFSSISKSSTGSKLRWSDVETGGRYNGEKYKTEYKPKPVWDPKNLEWTR